MNTVSVNKVRLLETLESNLEKHRKDFTEADDQYRGHVVAALRDRALKIEQGGEINSTFNLPKPVSYASEYEDAIRMLQWEVNDDVELSDYDFKQLVSDEWDWKQRFVATNSTYSSLQ